MPLPVQCSIRESRGKSLTESKCRALGGNQVPFPNINIVRGFASPFSTTQPVDVSGIPYPDFPPGTNVVTSFYGFPGAVSQGFSFLGVVTYPVPHVRLTILDNGGHRITYDTVQVQGQAAISSGNFNASNISEKMKISGPTTGLLTFHNSTDGTQTALIDVPFDIQTIALIDTTDSIEVFSPGPEGPGFSSRGVFWFGLTDKSQLPTFPASNGALGTSLL